MGIYMDLSEQKSNMTNVHNVEISQNLEFWF